MRDTACLGGVKLLATPEYDATYYQDDCIPEYPYVALMKRPTNGWPIDKAYPWLGDKVPTRPKTRPA